MARHGRYWRPERPQRRPISVAEFLALHRGDFFDDNQVELIDGEMFEKGLFTRRHGRTSAELMTALATAVRALGTDLEPLAAVSVHLDDCNLPDGDICVAVYAKDEDFVTPASGRLIVEVADLSLDHDLGRKKPLYARYSLPELWIADVQARTIIRFHSPLDDDYRERGEFAFGEAVLSATIPGLVIDTGHLAD